MYYIIELQTNRDGTGAHIVQTDTELNSAESKYHGILQFAAVSNVYMHAATILNAEGQAIMHQCYVHEPMPEEADPGSEE